MCLCSIISVYFGSSFNPRIIVFLGALGQPCSLAISHPTLLYSLIGIIRSALSSTVTFIPALSNFEASRGVMPTLFSFFLCSALIHKCSILLLMCKFVLSNALEFLSVEVHSLAILQSLDRNRATL